MTIVKNLTFIGMFLFGFLVVAQYFPCAKKNNNWSIGKIKDLFC